MALSSCRVRDFYELGDECYVELSFHELAHQMVDPSVWWCRSAQEDSTVLFRFDFRGVYGRESLDNLWYYRWNSDLRVLGLSLILSQVVSLLPDLTAIGAISG